MRKQLHGCFCRAADLFGLENIIGVNQPVCKRVQKKMGLEASRGNEYGPGTVRLNRQGLAWAGCQSEKTPGV